MKFYKILGLNVKQKNDACKILPMRKWEIRFLNVSYMKFDRHGRSPSFGNPDALANTLALSMKMRVLHNG